MHPYLEKIKSNLYKKEVIIIIVLTLIGFFLRAYHHSDWLHFQLDQSRDAYKVNAVIGENGSLSELPLIGPSARGTGLYLGPIFYYFQIITGFIFGNYPDKLAYPDLLFSVLTIPLAYILFKKYFSTNLSIGLTSLTVFSLFLIKYGRFAWNPNAMPFFTLLGMLALIKSIDNKKQIKTKWFLLMIACFAIASQLHFVALLSLAIILISYLSYKRPVIKLKQIALSILVIIFLYSPMIVYEIQAKGDNTKHFFTAITEKRDKDDNKSLFEKVFRDLQETSRTYWVINTSNQTGAFVKTKHESLIPKFTCAGKCDDEKSFMFLEVMLFTATTLLLIFFFKKEKNKEKKDLLFLIFLWIMTPFIVLIPLAFQISPRFYLVSAIPSIFLFGLLFKVIIQKVKYGKYIVYLLLLLAITINIINTCIYFNKLKIAKTKPSYLKRDLMVLKDEIVTLELIEATSDYMINSRLNDGPIEFSCNSRYARALKYILEMRHNEKTESVKETDLKPTKKSKNFYVITKTLSKSQVNKEVFEKFNIASIKEMGTFTIYQLTPKTE